MLHCTSIISEDDKQNVKKLQTDLKVLVQESKTIEKASKATAQKPRDKTFSEINLQTMDIEVQKFVALTHKSNELKLATDQLSVARAKLNVGVNDGATVKAYEDQLKLVKALVKSEGAERYPKQTAGLKNFIIQLEKYIALNDRVAKNPTLDAALNNMLTSAKADDGAGIVSNLDKYADAFKTTQMQVKHLGLEGQTYFTKLSAQMAKLGVYFSAATVMMGAWKQIKNMVSTVIELDKVVTDLQVATGYTRAETQALLTTYTALAKELGSTTLSVAQSADTWLRQGHSIESSNKLIKDTVMLSKLGQIDATEAAKALTSSMKGYKLETSEVTGVVDKFAAIDMKAAVSAGYLAKAIAETATGARLGGVEMDRLAGYIALVGETTQDGAESVGIFFKSMFARMGNIKEGKLIDPETQEDISTVESTLSNLGIKLRENGSEFRNYGDILDEVSAKWSSLSDVDRQALAVAFGQTRNQEKFLTLMDGYSTAMGYAEVAANSAGTALDKYENSYLVSVESAQERFTAQFEALSNTVLDSGLITGAVNTGTGLLGFLTMVSDKLGTLPTLLAVGMGAVSAFQNKGISNVKYAPPYLLGMAA